MKRESPRVEIEDKGRFGEKGTLFELIQVSCGEEHQNGRKNIDISRLRKREKAWGV